MLLVLLVRGWAAAWVRTVGAGVRLSIFRGWATLCIWLSIYTHAVASAFCAKTLARFGALVKSRG
jgi:hypothetical protein